MQPGQQTVLSLAFQNVYRMCTSADVENIVVAVLGLDSVYCNLGQLSSAWLSLQQDRSMMLWKDWTIHCGMRTHKAQHLIRKLLRGGKTTAVHLAGTL